MQQFKIRPGGFKELRKKMLLISIPLMLISSTVGIFAADRGTNGSGDVNILPFIIPFFALILGAALFAGVKRQQKIMETFVLSIDTDGAITREQYNTPTITIPKDEISAITHYKSGVIIVKGKDRIHMIGIPAQIEHPSEVLSALGALHPITTQTQLPLRIWLYLLVCLLTLGLMGALLTSVNKVIVVVSGTLLTTIMAWSFIEIRQSKQFDEKTKKGSYWTIAIILFILTQMHLKCR